MSFRIAKEWDLDSIMSLHREAFVNEKGVDTLVENLLGDPTSGDYISFVALRGGEVAGHVLFTAASIDGAEGKCMLLAPLAVLPRYQKKGLGTELTARSLEAAAAQGVELVFVLGHPAYYPRMGFRTAGSLGYEAPYPIPEKDADAWMVLELVPGALSRYHGKVSVANALMKPEYWVE